jgi:hypothetical protein
MHLGPGLAVHRATVPASVGEQHEGLAHPAAVLPLEDRPFAVGALRHQTGSLIRAATYSRMAAAGMRRALPIFTDLIARKRIKS